MEIQCAAAPLPLKGRGAATALSAEIQDFFK